MSELVRANDSKNCPNCGAPISSEKCPYCGTTFIDFACLDADKPFFMKIKQKGEIYILKVMLNSASMHTETMCVETLGSAIPRYIPRYSELSLDFTVID